MLKKITIILVLASMAIGGLFAATLSQEDTNSILWMREEEKLARDVYLALYERWGLTTFANIAQSEQAHMDSVKNELILIYGLTDPVINDVRGVFSIPELQELYDLLIETGSKSIADAVWVGMTIEDLDISDLNKAIKVTDNTDVQRVYTNLKKGSENHLRAFNKQAVKYGLKYSPQYISLEEYLQILSAK